MLERCKQQGVKVLARHVWGLRSTEFRLEKEGEAYELQCRVRHADVQKLLQTSGVDGLYVKALSFVQGRDAFPVMWLQRGTQPQVGLDFCAQQRQLTLGLVLGRGGGLGIRAAEGVSSEQLRGRIHPEYLTPLSAAGHSDRYTVTGMRAHELREDIVGTLQSAGWAVCSVARYGREGRKPARLIVAAQQDPPFARLLRGAKHPPLLIRPTQPSDRPAVRALAYTGKLTLPKPVPQQEAEEEAETTEHVDVTPPGTPHLPPDVNMEEGKGVTVSETPPKPTRPDGDRETGVTVASTPPNDRDRKGHATPEKRERDGGRSGLLNRLSQALSPKQK